MSLHSRLLLSSVFNMLLGTSSFYHTTSLNPIEIFVRRFANQSFASHYGYSPTPANTAWLWSAISVANAIGACTGALFLKYPAEKWGARNTVMVVKNVIQISACLLCYLSVWPFVSFELFIVGRFLCGVAVVFGNYLPVFLAECSPVEYRGMVATIAYLGSPLWNLIGTVMGLPVILGTEQLWRYSMLVPLIPGLIHLLLTPVFPHSPKYLFINRRQRHSSANSIRFYHGDRTDSTAILDQYEREAKLTEDIAENLLDKPQVDDVLEEPFEHHTVTLGEVMSTRHLLWPTALCVVANAASTLGGNDIIGQYSTGVILQLGVSAKAAPMFTVLLLQMPGPLIVLGGIFLIERSGRRPLMLTGIGLGVLATGGLFVGGLLERGTAPAVVLGVVGLCLGQIGYYIGPSFIAAMLAGELCPQDIRSLVSGLSFASSWLPSIIILFVYPPLQQMIGAYAILPLTVFGAISFVFFAVYLPETKGKPVDEIVKRWMISDDDSEEIPINGYNHNATERTALLSRAWRA